jgi:dihydrofolate reductase
MGFGYRFLTLVSSLINLGLIDELQLLISPIILGSGMALFKDVKGRHMLKSDKVGLTYTVQH